MGLSFFEGSQKIDHRPLEAAAKQGRKKGKQSTQVYKCTAGARHGQANDRHSSCLSSADMTAALRDLATPTQCTLHAWLGTLLLGTGQGVYEWASALVKKGERHSNAAWKEECAT